MAAGGRKEFGRRGVAAPPVVTNAPQGLPGARALSPARKRSLAIALVALGAGSIGGYAAYESARGDCPREGGQTPEDCRRPGGGHGGSFGHGWFFGGSGAHASSASAHEGSSGVRGFFGGFGRMGFGHGGGS
ncbi:hypothetical protein [Methylosinus sp. Sm6]|uniref:hypothetical protein n=1 Tax=Methylosinus sp. Sm6 TaxID=2866948 RepID=UPI001C9A25C0|nr:hypothetical protein [Methylosinus sp. Sm6]MBY6241302.1 hypothetical protein [Methylosinus sp. Sm6]